MEGLKNLLSYYNTLNKNYNMEYILSYKLSQDHLETFFSSIRSRGGYNNNPSAKEFKTSYKKLLVHHHVSGCQYGNCLPESMLSTKTNLINGPDTIMIESELNNSFLENSNDVDQNVGFLNDHDYFNSYYKVTDFVENITEYISGFIARKTIKRINCDICKGFLILNHTNNKLINIKDRNNSLIKPSTDVFYICSVSEKLITHRLKNDV